jgi:hypothetical protein
MPILFGPRKTLALIVCIVLFSSLGKNLCLR